MYLVKAPDRQPKKDAGGRTLHYWRLREKGQPTLAIGWLTEADAARALAVAEAKATLSRNGLAAVLPTPSPPSSPALAEWLTARLIPHLEARGRADKTLVSVRTSARHLIRLLGALPLDRIDAARWDGYVSTRRREGARGRTIQIEMGPLLQALRLAHRDGLIAQLPPLNRPTADDSRPHLFLTDAQSLQLLEALPWSLEPSSALAVYTCLELGMRRGECLSRRWEDIRWDQGENGAIHVGPRVEGGETVWKTKTRKARTVALTAGLKLALRKRHAALGEPATGWIFPSPYNPLQPLGNFKKTLKAACARAGLPLLHPHALRHSWATRAAIAGVPRVVAMAVGGWTDPRTLEAVYQHSVSGLEAQAVQQTSLGLDAAVPRAGQRKV